MKKLILIFNLILKTLFELMFVCTIMLIIGIFAFIITYLISSINNAIKEYHTYKIE